MHNYGNILIKYSKQQKNLQKNDINLSSLIYSKNKVYLNSKSFLHDLFESLLLEVDTIVVWVVFWLEGIILYLHYVNYIIMVNSIPPVRPVIIHRLYKLPVTLDHSFIVNNIFFNKYLMIKELIYLNLLEKFRTRLLLQLF